MACLAFIFIGLSKPNYSDSCVAVVEHIPALLWFMDFNGLVHAA
jgi:hypothetical protein